MERKKNFKLLGNNPNLKESIVDVSIIEFINYVQDNRTDVSSFLKMIMSIIYCFPELEMSSVHMGRCSIVQNKTLLSLSIQENNSRTISITISNFDHVLNFRNDCENFGVNLEAYLYRIYDLLILEHEALTYLENAQKVLNSNLGNKFRKSDLFIN